MSRYGSFRRKPQTRVNFFGHNLILWRDGSRREALRVWTDGNMMAVIQKNGHIGLKGSGIFDDEKNVHARVNAARALFGLNMVAPEFVAARERERDEHRAGKRVEELREEADDLGFMLVPFDKTKPKGKRVDRTDPEGGVHDLTEEALVKLSMGRARDLTEEAFNT